MVDLYQRGLIRTGLWEKLPRIVCRTVYGCCAGGFVFGLFVTKLGRADIFDFHLTTVSLGSRAKATAVRGFEEMDETG